MKLMIIESPGKRKKLSAILGAGWQVEASYGHIRDLPNRELGVDAPEFKPKYVISEGSEAVVSKLKALIQKADEVYLATDPDREGEAISWHLQQALNIKSPKRVAFSAINKTVVLAAVAQPRSIDIPRVLSQEARRVIDRLVGYMVSPALSNLAGTGMSAGRVQSPAVRLVVEKEREIRAFRVVSHYTVELCFADAKLTWTALWKTKPDFVSKENPYVLDAALAAEISLTKQVEVVQFGDSEEGEAPPAPFTTSTLQQAASVNLKLNPKPAMLAAQRLYEQGAITYHRTDNPNLDDETYEQLSAYCVSVGLVVVSKRREWKAKEGAQEGHPAVTPTDFGQECAGETDDEKALYALIRERAIASQLTNAVYAVRTVILKSAKTAQGKPVHFEAKGRTLIQEGWRGFLGGDATEAEDDKEQVSSNPVPQMNVGDVLPVSSGKVKNVKTKAPKRYTEASLVKKLESEGIGRPATYASIMEGIVSRSYVRHDGRYLVPTDAGEWVIDSLVGRFEFIDVGFTRELEIELDRIATGQSAYITTVRNLYERLSRELPALAGLAMPKPPCPECGKPLRRIKGKNGFFWGCSGYPECSETLPDVNGKPGDKKNHKKTSSLALPKFTVPKRKSL